MSDTTIESLTKQLDLVTKEFNALVTEVIEIDEVLREAEKLADDCDVAQNVGISTARYRAAVDRFNHKQAARVGTSK